MQNDEREAMKAENSAIIADAKNIVRRYFLKYPEEYAKNKDVLARAHLPVGSTDHEVRTLKQLT